MLTNLPAKVIQLARKHPGQLARLGPLRIVHAPAHVHEVLVRRAADYGKGGRMWGALRPLLGEGLLLAEGEAWGAQRRRANPYFSWGAVGKMQVRLGELAASKLDELLEDLTGQPPGRDGVLIDRVMREVSGHVFANLVLGSGCPPGLPALLQEALQHLNRRLFLSFMPEWAIPGNRRFHQVVRALNAQLPDLQGTIFSGAQMSEAEKRDQIITLFVAGSETIASAMTWMLCELAARPELGRHDLREVCSETLRLHPPVWFFPRFAARDTEVGGEVVPEGTTILLCPLATHRDPDLWPNPDAFDPSRWASQGAVDPCAYYPFGAGSRKCLGGHFAVAEMRAVVAAVLDRFTLRLHPRFDMAPVSATTLWPRRPHLYLDPR